MSLNRQLVRGSIGTILALALLVGPLGSPGIVRTAVADEEIELKIEEDLDMDKFLRTLSKLTGRVLIWNPQDKNIRGKKIMGGVNLKGTSEEFFSLARGLLTFYELVMIPVGPESNEVILVMDARQTSSILKLKPVHVKLTDDNLAHYEKQDGHFVTTTIRVEHMADLRNARNALTRIVTGQNIGNVTEVPDAKSFVVTDFAPNVVAIYRLLKEMDVPGAGTSTTAGRTEAIGLEHAVAADMANILGGHFAAPPQAPRGTQGPRPSAPRISADARTNRILVTGTDDQIAKVKEALALLDTPIIVSLVTAHILRLSHIRAAEASEALNILIESSPTLWRAGGPGAPRPSVVSHQETNSLLVSASKADFEQIQRLVKEMDVKPGKSDNEK